MGFIMYICTRILQAMAEQNYGTLALEKNFDGKSSVVVIF